jgi:uncharacterized protein (TIGR02145 family)
MKKVFSILAAVFLTATVWAQSPNKMSYQAVIRNSSDALVTNTQIGLEVNIRQGTTSGTVVYTETQTPTTNANGLVSIEIGGGSGFNTIDWANGPYFIETKTDPAGGTNYTITGTSQLLSVPYALYAKTAETITGGDALLARIEALEEKDLLNNGFTDPRDNNHYNVVKIGNQIWMVENLKYLPSVVGPETGSQTTPHYYVYGYNGTNVTDAKATANYNTYGVLYNWPAAMNGAASSTTNPSGVQGVCPDGWHLPSDAEWTELTDYLGGESVAGGKLKETGTTHWASPNTGATNETGFTALPGGYRLSNGPFGNIGSGGYWWSATEGSATNAWARFMFYNYSDVYRGSYEEEVGFSVRCVRD